MVQAFDLGDDFFLFRFKSELMYKVRIFHIIFSTDLNIDQELSPLMEFAIDGTKITPSNCVWQSFKFSECIIKVGICPSTNS